MASEAFKMNQQKDWEAPMAGGTGRTPRGAPSMPLTPPTAPTTSTVLAQELQQICGRVALEGSLRTASWRVRPMEEMKRTVDCLVPSIKCWARREVGRRLLLCTRLSDTIPPGLVEETKDYLVGWVVQAVLAAPLLEKES